MHCEDSVEHWSVAVCTVVPEVPRKCHAEAIYKNIVAFRLYNCLGQHCNLVCFSFLATKQQVNLLLVHCML
jgi:hypothetical protein